MPKKRAEDSDTAPEPAERPLHAPAFETPPPSPAETADDTDTEEK